MKKIALLLIVLLLGAGEKAVTSDWWPFGDEEADTASASVKTSSTRGNRHSQSFYAVKKEMLEKIYYDHRETLYCGAEFDKAKKIKEPQGFKLPNLKNVDFYVHKTTQEDLERKAERMEWEHIVPAENFGKTFTEWSEGHKKCVYDSGKKFKGRGCAEQENEEFRYMYTDMYNLYPSIGAVNYLRANFNFTQFGSKDKVKDLFGSCKMKISHNKAEPRNKVKGLIARTYFYMEDTYPRYKVGEPMRGVLKAWSAQYPVTPWECARAYRIEKVQGNANKKVKSACTEKGWYRNNVKN